MAAPIGRHEVQGEYEYDGVVYTENFPKETLDRIKWNFQFRDDDVMVVTYPKSGTTWLLEIVWLLMNKGDVVKAKEVDQVKRTPFIEWTEQCVPEQNIDVLEEADSPRIIKSHLSFDFFSRKLKNKKTKVIVCVRNIKDVLVSYYHFYRMNTGFGNFSGSFNEFFELFRDDHLVHGSWFDHVLDYWNNRHNFNCCFVKYEDLTKDFSSTVRSLAGFLGQELSDAKLAIIADHVSFDKMKENDRVNGTKSPDICHEISPFIRKGKVGDWRNYFTEEQNEYVDELYRRKIEAAGLQFDFE